MICLMEVFLTTVSSMVGTDVPRFEMIFNGGVSDYCK